MEQLGAAVEQLLREMLRRLAQVEAWIASQIKADVEMHDAIAGTGPAAPLRAVCSMCKGAAPAGAKQCDDCTQWMQMAP